MACFIPRSPMLLLLIWQFALIVCKVGIELVVIRYDATQYFFPLTSSATVLRNAIVMSRFRNLLPAPYLLSARIVSGRKVLLSVSGSFTAVSMAVLGLYCQLNDPKQAGESSFAHRSGSFLGVVVLALRQAVFLRFLLRYFTDDWYDPYSIYVPKVAHFICFSVCWTFCAGSESPAFDKYFQFRCTIASASGAYMLYWFKSLCTDTSFALQENCHGLQYQASSSTLPLTRWESDPYHGCSCPSCFLCVLVASVVAWWPLSIYCAPSLLLRNFMMCRYVIPLWRLPHRNLFHVPVVWDRTSLWGSFERLSLNNANIPSCVWPPDAVCKDTACIRVLKTFLLRGYLWIFCIERSKSKGSSCNRNEAVKFKMRGCLTESTLLLVLK